MEEENPKKTFWQNYRFKTITNNEILDYAPDYHIVCENFRNNFYKCAERVGLMNSASECSKFFEDYKECRFGIKKRQRLKAIVSERHKQGRPPIKDVPRDHLKEENGYNTENM